MGINPSSDQIDDDDNGNEKHVSKILLKRSGVINLKRHDQLLICVRVARWQW